VPADLSYRNRPAILTGYTVFLYHAGTICDSILPLSRTNEMNICLKTHVKYAKPQTVVVTLQERLPARVQGPCDITCTFEITEESDHYLLHFEASGSVNITCQRCLDSFPYSYYHQTTLAVCPNDAVAESLMASFECIDGQKEIDLNEVLTDDLYLILPEKHPDFSHCNLEISQLIID
jgi:uncharacterized protein